MRRRLVVGVTAASGRPLGSIWVGGAQPLAVGRRRCCSARVRSPHASSPAKCRRRRLRPSWCSGCSASTAASMRRRWCLLRPPVDGRYAVVGLGRRKRRGTEWFRRRKRSERAKSFSAPGNDDAMAQIGGALRLEASAFAAPSLTAVVGDRAYLPLPDTSVNRLTRWTTALVKRFDGRRRWGAVLRARSSPMSTVWPGGGGPRRVRPCAARRRWSASRRWPRRARRSCWARSSARSKGAPTSSIHA